MPRNAGSPPRCRVEPDGVLSPFAQVHATVGEEVALELTSRDHAVTAPHVQSTGVTIATVTATLTWTAVFDKVENGWVQGRIAELPGVITAAPTMGEAKAGLVDALHEYLASLAEPPIVSDATESETRETLDVVIRA